ncbi:DeoR/GlpR family DNA-binding transcription regulator [Loktanella sp. F6476L]|uniref:DeoR/GlpR family DNA-binding transcription regulator n=1 Tax=Loktanella sp. F6476L TaxID=2926405 RepID=UPI001FF65A3A|nr:DeoR/GlpR family DNA-binding transcription regulator [Loktanella sp. F6476L]MCK0119022.1 DeoR/GlpR family DNA-binding transcription regulator [Loktanella sp. F6476L]
MNLNIPDTRQQVLAERLADGRQIIAQDVAVEFDVSLDTIRRDILALEADGKAQRVRGGAVPIAAPSSPLHSRLAKQPPVNTALIDATIAWIADAPTVLFDGGTTTLAIAARLPIIPGRLVVTPSPWIAVACQERSIPVFLLGGTLSASGGIATGDVTHAKIATLSADIAVLGACGLDCDFGLSSDDHAEAMVKAAMATAASRTLVVTDAAKIGRRARHHTLALDQIDDIVTDALSEMALPLSRAGARVITA